LARRHPAALSADAAQAKEIPTIGDAVHAKWQLAAFNPLD
jgi:hypothetical protein